MKCYLIIGKIPSITSRSEYYLFCTQHRTSIDCCVAGNPPNQYLQRERLLDPGMRRVGCQEWQGGGCDPPRLYTWGPFRTAFPIHPRFGRPHHHCCTPAAVLAAGTTAAGTTSAGVLAAGTTAAAALLAPAVFCN